MFPGLGARRLETTKRDEWSPVLVRGRLTKEIDYEEGSIRDFGSLALMVPIEFRNCFGLVLQVTLWLEGTELRRCIKEEARIR